VRNFSIGNVGATVIQLRIPRRCGSSPKFVGSEDAWRYKPFQFKLRRKDGSPIWVDVQGTPMHNAAGVFQGIVGTISVSTKRLSKVDRLRSD
jgi:hypothetical protein